MTHHRLGVTGANLCRLTISSTNSFNAILNGSTIYWGCRVQELCTLEAVTVKQLERQLDGMVRPADTQLPIRAVEVHFYKKKRQNVYWSATEMYESVAKAGSTTEESTALQQLFIATIFSRFKNKSRTEINQMLRILDIKETRCGREIYAEGARQGKLEGKLEGKTELLVRMACKRFPKLAPADVEQIQHLDFLQLERLADVLFDLPKAATLRACPAIGEIEAQPPWTAPACWSFPSLVCQRGPFPPRQQAGWGKLQQAGAVQSYEPWDVRLRF